jgi:ketosteroid isomerase-like protein
MSSNGDTARHLLEVWNRGAPIPDEELSRFVQSDIELDMSARVFNPATYAGLAGFRRFQQEVQEIWAEFRVEPEQVFEAGDQVVALVRAVGRGRQSGVEIHDRIAMTFSFRDGKVAALGVNPDASAALESVGLPADAASPAVRPRPRSGTRR